MRKVLIVLTYVSATIALIGPVLFWVYVSAMACAFVTNSNGCGVDLADFWDDEFISIAALPWALGVALIWMARRLGRASA